MTSYETEIPAVEVMGSHFTMQLCDSAIASHTHHYCASSSHSSAGFGSPSYSPIRVSCTP